MLQQPMDTLGVKMRAFVELTDKKEQLIINKRDFYF